MSQMTCINRNMRESRVRQAQVLRCVLVRAREGGFAGSVAGRERRFSPSLQPGQGVRGEWEVVAKRDDVAGRKGI